MKSAGLLFIAISLLFSASARATDVAATDKPYASIVVRNMFGLVPIPPPPPPNPGPAPEPPPKITPNGTMTLFGKLEVLFKVATKGKPGQTEDSYILAEGEMQDGVTVVKINQEDGIITFKNHGEIQDIPLTVAANLKPSGGPGGQPAMGAGLNPGQSSRQSLLSPAMRGRLGQNINPSNPGNPGNADNVGGPNLGGNNSQSPGEPEPPKTIEEQVMAAARDMALIEQNRIATQRAVDIGLMPPLPPTMLTPADATAAGGSPLIVPSEGVPQVPTGR